jgi:hypothetical protein
MSPNAAWPSVLDVEFTGHLQPFGRLRKHVEVTGGTRRVSWSA